MNIMSTERLGAPEEHMAFREIIWPLSDPKRCLQQGIKREPRAVGFSGYDEVRNIAEREGSCINLLRGRSYCHNPNGVFEKTTNPLLLQCHRALTIRISDERGNR